MAYYMNKSVPAKRGDIFYISNSKCYATDPSNTEGRPAIVVSSDKLNEHADVVEVVYLTTKEMEGVNAGILCSLGIAAPVVDGEPVDNSVMVERNLYKHLYEDLLNKVMAR
jgi:mRNA interferase MazF